MSVFVAPDTGRRSDTTDDHHDDEEKNWC